MSATERFTEYVRGCAVVAGYDLSGPRSGGRKALAEATGMSHASVCRMLNGQVVPSPEFFESLGAALNIPVGELFELAGVVSPGVLTGRQAVEPQPLTVQMAAARLGITRPLHVALFEAVTATLLAEQGGVS
ncbi:helix-turn-helix domain-containing protein [Streptomyces xanthochromogenes]|uniref:helix-turn-helix domain-containing protein n=1 Tax=Streptomyces xanthochromogenes TaxID=67384 RepID=UPI0037F4308A